MTGQQLRNSILQEAIQGRLVPNVLLPGEKTGAELLQDILARRQKKENEEKGKKAKLLSLSTMDEEPWNLPEGWCWVRLGDIVDYRSGLWEGKKPPFIRVGVIRNANFTKRFTLSFDNIAYLNVEEKQYLSRKLEYGDIIIEKSGGGENQPVGRPVLFLKTEGDFSFSNFTQMLRIADKALILPMFLQQVLMEFYVSGVTINLQSNTTNLRNLDFKGYLDLSIPLPPLSIQKAIVNKIEELFPLVDEYEKASVELNSLNDQLPDKLRKSILQEAIHGNLVSNDIPNGEATAPELLQQILKERQDRENKAKGKKAKKLTLSTIEEEPWELPEGWCWCRGKDIFFPMESIKPTSDFVYIDTDAVNNKKNIIDNPKKVLLKDAPSRATRKLHTNDILFSMVRPYLKNIAFVDERFGTAIGTTGFYVITTSATLYQPYIFKMMLSDYVVSGLTDYMKGDNSPSINNGHIEEFLYPIPPLSIQHHIVEKIEKVFAAIDKLQV